MTLPQSGRPDGGSSPKGC